MRLVRPLSVLALLVCVVVAETCRADVIFEGLGALLTIPNNAYASRAFGVSGDGSTIVGQTQSNLGPQAFRWTASTGMVGIGDLPDGVFISSASGANADGSVIVGTGSSDGQNGLSRAFRWTSDGGIQPLGVLPTSPTSYFFSSATAVSADGNKAAVYTNYVSAEWTNGAGYEVVNSANSRPLAMSADGNVIVGDMNSAGKGVAYRWTPSGGLEILPILPGTTSSTSATAVSPNGLVIAGNSQQNTFRWTAAGGLESVSGFSTSPAIQAMSWDGSTMVGNMPAIPPLENQFRTLAAVWTAAQGTRSLEDILVRDYGVNLHGWRLISATGVSWDGSVIVGYGLNPSAKYEAFRVVVPEANSLLLVSGAVAAAFRFAGRRSALRRLAESA